MDWPRKWMALQRVTDTHSRVQEICPSRVGGFEHFAEVDMIEHMKMYSLQILVEVALIQL